MPARYPSTYGRMFPLLPSISHPEDDLIRLGELMLDDPAGPEPKNVRTLPALLSGFLFFSQFVDHDLSLDLTPLSEAGAIPPEARINHRHPYLDLDSLYGDGPLGSPWLYDLPNDASGKPRHPGNERLVVGETTPSNKLRDLPRTTVGRPVMADGRNEENLILAQLHVLFLRFHNRVMDALDVGPGPDVGMSNRS